MKRKHLNPVLFLTSDLRDLVQLSGFLVVLNLLFLADFLCGLTH